MKHYRFTPDYNNIVLAAKNIQPPRMPLYEHIVGGRMMKDIIGVDPYPGMESSDASVRDRAFSDFWRFWRTMGYDTASYECCAISVFPGGGALGAHRPGAIHSREEFEKYPWNDIPDMFFDRYGKCFESLARTCPDGMRAVGGVGNGVFECVQDLVGYMDLCYLGYDDPELYGELFKCMGGLLSQLWTRFLREYADAYCVLRFGDDLGFKSTTLLSKEDVVKHILPQYKRIVDLVHAAGKPFLLHSCGNLFNVFDEIIADTGIDAKHSNEDQIAHFSVWTDRYGDRIGNFGGIDTDVLCRRTPAEIRDYVIDSLNRVSGCGGVAFASGNSIPDYVPTEGYVAMVETVRDWRGDEEA